MTRRGMLDSFARKPRLWFYLGLIWLLPFHLLLVYQNEWFGELPKPVGDGLDYENLAFHLWRGEGFVFDSSDVQWRAPYVAKAELYQQHLDAPPRTLAVTGRPPLFPLLIAGLYKFIGRDAMGLAAVHMLLASCLAISGALAGWVTARLLSHTVSMPLIIVGVLSTWGIHATNRTLRTYTEDFLTEPLALLLTELLVVAVVGLLAQQPTPPVAPARCTTNGVPNATTDQGVLSAWKCVGRSALLGILLGTMILARSLFVLWIPGVAILVYCSFPGARRRRLVCAALVACFVCLVCGPWWIRNMLVLHAPMPLGTQGAITLVGGYCDASLEAGGDWQFAPELQLRSALAADGSLESAANETQREVVVARAARRQVHEWIGNHTTELPALAWARIATHWSPYSGPSLAWKLAALAGGCCLLLRRDRLAWWFLGLPLLSTLLAASLYTTGGRFLVPLYGLLFSLAGYGLSCGISHGLGKFPRH